MILIAIGANLPGPALSPQENCAAAAAALRDLPGLRWCGLSRWYRSAPIPVSDQPPYINGAAALEGEVDPAWLLAELQSIEARLGRTRSVANAARTLDLDIIDVNGMVRDSPDPILPHPRAHERAFVLLPMADLIPGWVHPRLGQSVAALLRGLPPQGIDPL